MVRDERSDESWIHRRHVDPSTEDVNTELVRIVADLKDRDPAELPTFWRRVDSLVGDLFSDPPSDEAGACVKFNYAGYRITVAQDGNVELVERPADDE